MVSYPCNPCTWQMCIHSFVQHSLFLTITCSYIHHPFIHSIFSKLIYSSFYSFNQSFSYSLFCRCHPLIYIFISLYTYLFNSVSTEHTLKCLLHAWNWRGCESKKESDRELRREDMAARNHSTKKQVMDSNREGLKNDENSYPRDIFGAWGWGQLETLERAYNLDSDLALNLVLPLSVALP